MNVIVAKSAGFCYGVNRAVDMCIKAAETHESCVTLGPIIHNAFVIRELEKKGVRVVSDILEVSEKDTVIIRSHGAGRAEHEALTALSVDIIDATCPDVKKIHEIVQAESEENRLIVIIGHRHHPEIEAISGWCNDFVIFETSDELKKWLNINENAKLPTSFVFQTTNSRSIYETCAEIIKKECTNQRIFDTICDATFLRQHEAAEISKTADVVIIAGDNNSANSLNLADICKEHCSRVLFVQSASDINLADIQPEDVVGITAGASTPAFIIKEVTRKMKEEVNVDGTPVEQESTEVLPEPEQVNTADTEVSAEPEADVEPTVEEPAEIEEPEAIIEVAEEAEPEIITEVVDEAEDPEAAADAESADESFEEMLEKSIKTLRTGEKVTGIVTSITATEVSLDLGTKQSGYIPIAEFR